MLKVVHRSSTCRGM